MAATIDHKSMAQSIRTMLQSAVQVVEMNDLATDKFKETGDIALTNELTARWGAAYTEFVWLAENTPVD